jgi:hypothetical protein
MLYFLHTRHLLSTNIEYSVCILYPLPWGQNRFHNLGTWLQTKVMYLVKWTFWITASKARVCVSERVKLETNSVCWIFLNSMAFQGCLNSTAQKPWEKWRKSVFTWYHCSVLPRQLTSQVSFTWIVLVDSHRIRFHLRVNLSVSIFNRIKTWPILCLVLYPED